MIIGSLIDIVLSTPALHLCDFLWVWAMENNLKTMRKVEWMKGGDAEREWGGRVENYRETERERWAGSRERGKMSQLIYLPVSMTTGGLSHPLSPYSLCFAPTLAHSLSFSLTRFLPTPPVTQLGCITSVCTCLPFVVFTLLFDVMRIWHFIYCVFDDVI